MISSKNLCFYYKRNRPAILHNLTIDFPERGLVAILGPNGSGKTTLLKCLSGILDYQGSLTLNKRELNSIPRQQLARQISYVPQDYNPAFNMTVFDYIMLGRLPYINWNISPKDQQQVNNILALMQLTPFSQCDIWQLSGGQKQLVSIARALAQATQIILMDEPLSALDLKHSLQVMQNITNIVEQQQALVITILHDIELAARYCDQLVILKEGTIYDYGPPQQVITEPMLKQVYDVDATIHFDQAGCRIICHLP